MWLSSAATGGYVCAIRCRLGSRRRWWNATNWRHLPELGLIPTKRCCVREIWHLMHRLNEFGFSADNFSSTSRSVARSPP
jgi:hypothetical protein